MPSRAQLVLLCLIAAQAAHSTEEYFSKLYDVFPPARFASGVVSSDLARGFLILNTGIVTLGILCWAGPVRLGWGQGRALAWFWALLEIANGLGHTALALGRHGYFPGLATAPLLLFFGGWLAAVLAS
jgi:Protein of unknown function with HXXEE motif